MPKIDLSDNVTDMSDLIISADSNFMTTAWQELQKSTTQARRKAILADGVWAGSINEQFNTLGEKWRQSPPIFVRHICPIQSVTELSGNIEDDLAILRRALNEDLIGLFNPKESFSVQIRLLSGVEYKPFQLNDPLAQSIRDRIGIDLNVRQPHTILSIVVARIEKLIVGFAGVSLASHNLSDWAGGERRFQREEGQVSRAEFKLLEALAQFNVVVPERGIALDLGAAPGGWTRILRQQQPELMVIAVDPAELHESLTNDWLVHHVRDSAEHFRKTIPAKTKYDLIVNDMRLDARRSSLTMVNFAPHLKKDGKAIITLKLPEKHAPIIMETAFKTLKQGYEIISARQLFHNRNEVTVYLRPLPEV